MSLSVRTLKMILAVTLLLQVLVGCGKPQDTGVSANESAQYGAGSQALGAVVKNTGGTR